MDILLQSADIRDAVPVETDVDRHHFQIFPLQRFPKIKGSMRKKNEPISTVRKEQKLSAHG
jgi:hypothetical protein